MENFSIHVIFEHAADRIPFGCAYIRDLLPLSHPSNSGDLLLTSGVDYARADVILVERMWKPGINGSIAEQLIEKVHKDNSILVYSIDDNLLDLENVPDSARSAVRMFCCEANGIIVSTENLKDRLKRLNRNIFVVPNAVDERLFMDPDIRREISTKPVGKTFVGYMGTPTHDADLMMVLQPLRMFLRKNSEEVELQIVGGFSTRSMAKAFDGLPVRILNVATEDVEYPNFVRWMKKNLHWDFAIAPLEDNFFNLCKSDIKFLDYSALGIPAIYSDVSPYQKTISHLETGYLVQNQPSNWAEALEFLLVDREARNRMATNAYDYVCAYRTLKQCAVEWKNAIHAIVKIL